VKILAFDTATDDTVVAAADQGRLVYERVLPPDDRHPVHGRALLQMIEDAVSALGGWDQVERIAVGIGPGIFTGIRVGVATAAGLSASSGSTVVGIPTLAALARSIGAETGDSLIVPLVDARRGEVFGALCPAGGGGVGEPFTSSPEDLAEMLRNLPGGGAAPRVAGPGAIRFRDELVRAGLEIEPAGSPVHKLGGSPFCELGLAAETVGPETLKPLYLRNPDAQLWLERDSNSSN